jgi:hypothetical protein
MTKEKTFSNKLLNMLIICGSVLILSILIMKLFNQALEINELKLSQNQIINERDNYKMDNALRENLIGKKINFNEFVPTNITKNEKVSKYKVVIIADAASCTKCFISAISFYKKLFIRNNMNGIPIILIFPSGNIKSARISFRDITNENISVLVDTSFQFVKKAKVPISKSAVLFLNQENYCMYAYIVNPLIKKKNNLESKIFENILASSISLQRIADSHYIKNLH